MDLSRVNEFLRVGYRNNVPCGIFRGTSNKTFCEGVSSAPDFPPNEITVPFRATDLQNLASTSTGDQQKEFQKALGLLDKFNDDPDGRIQRLLANLVREQDDYEREQGYSDDFPGKDEAMSEAQARIDKTRGRLDGLLPEGIAVEAGAKVLTL